MSFRVVMRFQVQLVTLACNTVAFVRFSQNFWLTSPNPRRNAPTHRDKLYVIKYSNYQSLVSPTINCYETQHLFHFIMPPWLFVSPASRGIGLEVARRLLRTTDLPLVATARTNLDETRSQLLEGVGKDIAEDRLHVLKLDVCGPSSFPRPGHLRHKTNARQTKPQSPTPQQNARNSSPATPKPRLHTYTSPSPSRGSCTPKNHPCSSTPRRCFRPSK